jgi:hypothetical protein
MHLLAGMMTAVHSHHKPCRTGTSRCVNRLKLCPDKRSCGTCDDNTRGSHTPTEMRATGFAAAQEGMCKKLPTPVATSDMFRKGKNGMKRKVYHAGSLPTRGLP